MGQGEATMLHGLGLVLMWIGGIVVGVVLLVVAAFYWIKPTREQEVRDFIDGGG